MSSRPGDVVAALSTMNCWRVVLVIGPASTQLRIALSAVQVFDEPSLRVERLNETYIAGCAALWRCPCQP